MCAWNLEESWGKKLKITWNKGGPGLLWNATINCQAASPMQWWLNMLLTALICGSTLLILFATVNIFLPALCMVAWGRRCCKQMAWVMQSPRRGRRLKSSVRTALSSSIACVSFFRYFLKVLSVCALTVKTKLASAKNRRCSSPSVLINSECASDRIFLSE